MLLEARPTCWVYNVPRPLRYTPPSPLGILSYIQVYHAPWQIPLSHGPRGSSSPLCHKPPILIFASTAHVSPATKTVGRKGMLWREVLEFNDGMPSRRHAPPPQISLQASAHMHPEGDPRISDIGSGVKSNRMVSALTRYVKMHGSVDFLRINVPSLRRPMSCMREEVG